MALSKADLHHTTSAVRCYLPFAKSIRSGVRISLRRSLMFIFNPQKASNNFQSIGKDMVLELNSIHCFEHLNQVCTQASDFLVDIILNGSFHSNKRQNQIEKGQSLIRYISFGCKYTLQLCVLIYKKKEEKQTSYFVPFPLA